MMDTHDAPPHLIVPGWAGSGSDHWQSFWQVELGAARVEMRDWVHADCGAWIAALDIAVDELAAHDPRPPVLVAHSLGCVVIAQWAYLFRRPIRAAFLVAPADVEQAASLASLRSFGPIPARPLPFDSFVVASDDDPHVASDRAESFAAQWGSQFELIPRAGHLNAASRLGAWPRGRELLARLLRRTVEAHPLTAHPL